MSTIDEIGYIWDACAPSDCDSDEGERDSVDDEEGQERDDDEAAPAAPSSPGPAAPPAPPSTPLNPARPSASSTAATPASVPYQSIKSVPIVSSRRASLRQFLSSNIDFSSLLHQTKFLPDDALLAFVSALISLCEGDYNPDGTDSSSSSGSTVDPAVDEFVCNGSRKTAQEIIRSCAVPPPSQSNPTPLGTSAFAEVLLCEVALRNRDRITAIFPLLEEHYKLTLGRQKTCTFHTEKAATGLLRICNRFADKPALFSSLVQLYRLLIPPRSDNSVTSAL